MLSETKLLNYDFCMPLICLILDAIGCSLHHPIEDSNAFLIRLFGAEPATKFHIEMLRDALSEPVERGSWSQNCEVITMHNDSEVTSFVQEHARRSKTTSASS